MKDVDYFSLYSNNFLREKKAKGKNELTNSYVEETELIVLNLEIQMPVLNNYLKDVKSYTVFIDTFSKIAIDVSYEHKAYVNSFDGITFKIYLDSNLESSKFTIFTILQKIFSKFEEYLERLNLKSNIQFIRSSVTNGQVVFVNTGNSKRMLNFSFGLAPEIGYRLLYLNKQYGSIGLTTLELDLSNSNLIFRELDTVRFSNTDKRAYKLFEYLDKRKVSTALIETFKNAMSEFKKRKYKSALKIFSEYLEQVPNDKVPTLYINRCEQFLKIPPASHWDGIYNIVD